MNYYDCKTVPITTDFDNSLYCQLASIPKYKNDGVYTQGHKFILRFDETSVDFRSTTIRIFTSNSSNKICAWYSDIEPELNVIINDDGNKWGIYVRPSGLYSVPIGMQILSSENPATLELVDGDYPRFSIDSFTNKVDIKPKFMYIKRNNVIMGNDIKKFITNTNNVGVNYDVMYDSSEGTDICPNNEIGIWYISYKEGLSENALQYWTMIKDSTVYKYVRSKIDNQKWGNFLEF